MFGSTEAATPLGQRPLRLRAAAWLAVLAFGFAQFLLGTHVHATTGAHEPQQSMCAVCAFTDDTQLAVLSTSQAASLLRQCMAKAQPLEIVIERQAHRFQPRAPPSS